MNTNMVRAAYGRHWSPAEKGGDILFDLGVAEKHADITGKYFDNDSGMFGQAHRDAYDEEKVSALIQQTDILLRELGPSDKN